MKIVNVPKRILDIAHKEAKKTSILKARMAALAVDKRLSNVLGRAFNVKILGNNKKFSIHCEENLLIKYRHPIHTILVYRNYKENDLGCSKPCARCWELLRRANVRHVIFWENGQWIKEKI